MSWNNRRRFAIRTIRPDGTVEINGRVFESAQEPVPTRLRGKRAAFGLYYVGDRWDDAHVSLWGDEESFRATDEETSTRLWPGPFCEDGVFKWEWWSLSTPTGGTE